MMIQNRYILQKYQGIRSRYTCPACGKKRQFARYIDTETGQHLSEDCGRCNREDNCGYHLTPSEFFVKTGKKPYLSDYPKKNELNRNPITHDLRAVDTKLPPKITRFDPAIMERSLTAYNQNNLALFLSDQFHPEAVREALSQYKVGTSRHWPGSTVFWQIDHAGEVRAGKIMQYATTGRRVKEPYSRITWAHSVLKIEMELQQCFFGQHLLPQFPEKTVCLAESEKSALIASICLPQYLWLATGGKNGARWTDPEAFEPLRGRTIILWPDLGAWEAWSEKAKELKALAKITVSDLLERKATASDRQKGLDIADYLLREPGIYTPPPPKPQTFNIEPAIYTDPLPTPQVFNISDLEKLALEIIGERNSATFERIISDIQNKGHQEPAAIFAAMIDQKIISPAVQPKDYFCLQGSTPF